MLITFPCFVFALQIRTPRRQLHRPNDLLQLQSTRSVDRYHWARPHPNPDVTSVFQNLVCVILAFQATVLPSAPTSPSAATANSQVCWCSHRMDYLNHPECCNSHDLFVCLSIHVRPSCLELPCSPFLPQVRTTRPRSLSLPGLTLHVSSSISRVNRVRVCRRVG
jgi:hypothetical protein